MLEDDRRSWQLQPDARWSRTEVLQGREGTCDTFATMKEDALDQRRPVVGAAPAGRRRRVAGPAGVTDVPGRVRHAVEVEIKYRVVSSGAADRFRHRRRARRVRAPSARSGRCSTRTATSTRPTAALARAGFGARLRQAGNGFLVGLKSLGTVSGAGGAYRREELEGPADKALPPADWPASAARVAGPGAGRRRAAGRGRHRPAAPAQARVPARTRRSSRSRWTRWTSWSAATSSSGSRSWRSRWSRATTMRSAELGDAGRGDDRPGARGDVEAGARPGGGASGGQRQGGAGGCRAGPGAGGEPGRRTERRRRAGPATSASRERGRRRVASGGGRRIGAGGEPARPKGTPVAPTPGACGDARAGPELASATPRRPDAGAGDGRAAGATDAPRAAGALTRPPLHVGKSPGVLAEDHLAEAGRKVLRFHLAKMLAVEPGTRSGEDPEDLHKMRVATRRQRAAWRVFGDALRRQADEDATVLACATSRAGWARSATSTSSSRTASPTRRRRRRRSSARSSRSSPPGATRRDEARVLLIKELDSPQAPRLARRLSRLRPVGGARRRRRRATDPAPRPGHDAVAHLGGLRGRSRLRAGPALGRRRPRSTSCGSAASGCATRWSSCARPSAPRADAAHREGRRAPGPPGAAQRRRCRGQPRPPVPRRARRRSRRSRERGDRAVPHGPGARAGSPAPGGRPDVARRSPGWRSAASWAG